MMCGIYIFIIVAYSTTVAMQAGQELNCPEGELYYNCSHIVCFKSCKDLREGPPCPQVSLDCYHPSCECDGGLFRSDAGDCVTRESCSV